MSAIPEVFTKSQINEEVVSAAARLLELRAELLRTAARMRALGERLVMAPRWNYSGDIDAVAVNKLFAGEDEAQALGHLSVLLDVLADHTKAAVAEISSDAKFRGES